MIHHIMRLIVFSKMFNFDQIGAVTHSGRISPGVYGNHSGYVLHGEEKFYCFDNHFNKFTLIYALCPAQTPLPIIKDPLPPPKVLM